MRVHHGGREIELGNGANCVCGHSVDEHSRKTTAGEIIAGADSWCVSCECPLFRWTGFEWDGVVKVGERTVAQWGDEWIVCTDDALCLCGQKKSLHDPRVLSGACSDFRWVMSRETARDRGQVLTERDIRMMRAGFKMGFGGTSREINFDVLADSRREERAEQKIVRVALAVEEMFEVALEELLKEGS